MANTANSVYVFEFENVAEADKFINTFERIAPFDEVTLSEVLKKYGGDPDVMDREGFVQCWYKADNDPAAVRIEVHSKWDEPSSFRHEFERVTGCKIYYIVEEPGCGVFYTNDKQQAYFTDAYRVYYDKTGYGYDNEYFADIEPAFTLVEELTGREIRRNYQSLMAAIEEFNKAGEEAGEFIQFDEFLYRD